MYYEREKVVEFARDGLALSELPLMCRTIRSSIAKPAAFFLTPDD